MNRLTIFYLSNYFVLLAYIIVNAIFLGRGEVGIFHLLMTINTPFFLIIMLVIQNFGSESGYANNSSIQESDFDPEHIKMHIESLSTTYTNWIGLAEHCICHTCGGPIAGNPIQEHERTEEVAKDGPAPIW